MKRLEAHMIRPIKTFMEDGLGLSMIAEEFSAGYGRADLVGAYLSDENHFFRKENGLKGVTIDNYRLVETLMALRLDVNVSYEQLLRKVGVAESTLQKSILPRLVNLGLVEHNRGKSARLLYSLPSPADHIVAVEAKQARWRDAILQARRYTFFADYTYIAVWNGKARLVDKSLLYRHRLGLIGVEVNSAEILIEAPKRNPRIPQMNRYCAEFLYSLWLQA
ncbi:hypothetical protein CEE36_08600 [candidate division TA06 bacterium B3_TA06]|uniref:Uncharacterized protein n=1 Tax=candidate division TA06 bacterium B3_TA06 TaxID=2012487 RepID=A0A532V2B0_UNCT6|nr:MAG: hypothetical protein CEE36_08600 [candidate division TA06 bacterium B3_TA06]